MLHCREEERVLFRERAREEERARNRVSYEQYDKRKKSPLKKSKSTLQVLFIERKRDRVSYEQYNKEPKKKPPKKNHPPKNPKSTPKFSLSKEQEIR